MQRSSQDCVSTDRTTVRRLCVDLSVIPLTPQSIEVPVSQFQTANSPANRISGISQNRWSLTVITKPRQKFRFYTIERVSTARLVVSRYHERWRKRRRKKRFKKKGKENRLNVANFRRSIIVKFRWNAWEGNYIFSTWKFPRWKISMANATTRSRISPGTKYEFVTALCPESLLFRGTHRRLCFRLVKRWANRRGVAACGRQRAVQFTLLNHVYSARLRYHEVPLQHSLRSTLVHACIITAPTITRAGSDYEERSEMIIDRTRREERIRDWTLGETSRSQNRSFNGHRVSTDPTILERDLRRYT